MNRIRPYQNPVAQLERALSDRDLASALRRCGILDAALFAMESRAAATLRRLGWPVERETEIDG